jgi:hypothetical protein
MLGTLGDSASAVQSRTSLFRFEAIFEFPYERRRFILVEVRPQCVRRRHIKPSLIRAVLIAARSLFNEESWPRRLIDMEENGTEAALALVDYSYNTVLNQVDLAMRQLQPVDKRQLLGHQTGRHE